MAIGAVALLAAGLRGAEGANSGSYSDPSGDYVGGSPDITAITIANNDSGVVTVTIQFAASRPLVSGMGTGVYFDTDANQSTGSSTGSEYEMELDISQNQWSYSRWTGSWEQVTSATGSVSFNSTSATFSINRSELGNTSRLNFWVFGNWTANSSDYDFAPTSGAFGPYDVIIASTTTTPPATTTTPPATTTPPPATTTPPATTNPVTPVSVVDTDKDGVADKSDACPKTHGGKFDKNKNGCPGPFGLIPLPALKDISPRLSSIETTWWDPKHPAMVRGLPAGAHVQLKIPSGTIVSSGGKARRLNFRWVLERGNATSAGVFRSNVLSRGRYLNREVIELRVWKQGWIGYSQAMIIQTRAPLLVFGSRRCIPPTSSTPLPCNRVGRGS